MRELAFVCRPYLQIKNCDSASVRHIDKKLPAQLALCREFFVDL